MRQKPIASYSEEYYEVCKRAHNASISMPFDTNREALNFRIEMYLFRKALREALTSNPDNEHLQISVLFAEGLEFSVKENILTIQQKKSKAAKKLQEIL
jgi:hypothetical protein